jgi:hypothetical protein
LNVTARYEAHVKVFEEERVDHDVVVDISGSGFGSKTNLRKILLLKLLQRWRFHDTK